MVPMRTPDPRLIDVLGELVALLESNGAEHWRAYVADCRAAISIGSPRGLETLRQASGYAESLDEPTLPPPGDGIPDSLVDRIGAIAFADEAAGGARAR